MIEENNLVKEVNGYLAITERFYKMYDKEQFPYNHGFFEGASYMLNTILDTIRKEQKYEDNQQFCNNDHDSIMKYDKQKHDGYYYVKEKMRN